MYFGRLKQEELVERKTLPTEWMEEFTTILNEAYEQNRTKDDRFFEVYGEIYKEEFVVIVSYIHNNDPMRAPITLFISHDNQESSKEFKKTLSALVNFTSLIFDDVFSKDEWFDYNIEWTENSFEGSNFFYKITRENVSLTLQAEAILKSDIELN